MSPRPRKFAASPRRARSSGLTFFKVFDDQHLEFIVILQGDDESVFMNGRMASFQIQELMVAYKGNDKDNHQNLLLDNSFS